MTTTPDKMTDEWLIDQFKRANMLASSCQPDELFLRNTLRGFANRVLQTFARDSNTAQEALDIPFTKELP